LNLTLSLIAGLTLLLPGLSALAAWNFKGAVEGAPGAEIPLTSVNGLFVVIGISAVLHLAGYWLAYWIWASIPAFSALMPGSPLPIAAEPYQTLWQLVTGTGKGVGGAAVNQSPSIEAVAELGLAILLLCGLAVRVSSSRLLDVVLDGRDTRGLGWVYQNVIRPRRNGYEPFAYVMTMPAQGDFGLGYQGMVADSRTFLGILSSPMASSHSRCLLIGDKLGLCDRSRPAAGCSDHSRLRESVVHLDLAQLGSMAQVSG